MKPLAFLFCLVLLGWALPPAFAIEAMTDLGGSYSGDGVSTRYSLPTEKILKLPPWDPTREIAPVAMPKIVAAAIGAYATEHGVPAEYWQFGGQTLRELSNEKGRWLYYIRIVAAPANPLPVSLRNATVLVLHDGTPVTAKVTVTQRAEPTPKTYGAPGENRINVCHSRGFLDQSSYWIEPGTLLSKFLEGAELEVPLRTEPRLFCSVHNRFSGKFAERELSELNKPGNDIVLENGDDVTVIKAASKTAQ